MKNKASIVLFFMMVLFMVSYPYRESFLGGLFNAGMLAAVIGGLADWFAVKALFEKPLGIGFRTEVIIRNRERIFGDLIDFVSKDLLGKENIIKILDKYNLTKLALNYIEESDGENKIKNFIFTLINIIIKECDKEQFAKIFEGILKDKMKNINMSKPLVEALIKTIQKDNEDDLIKKMLIELEIYIHHPALKDIFADIIAEVKRQYIGNGQMREMASKMMDLSEEQIAKVIQTELGNYLRSLQDENNTQRIMLKEYLIEILNEQKDNYQLEQKVNMFFEHLIDDKLDVSKFMVKYFNNMLEGNLIEIKNIADNIVDRYIDLLKSEYIFQKKSENFLKEVVIHFINEKHDVLEEKIKEKLVQLSDDALKELVKNRVGDDLQMIRINGSVVGAMVGMVLYFITFIAERFI